MDANIARIMNDIRSLDSDEVDELHAAYDKRKATKSSAIGLTDLLLACPSSFEMIERERDDSEPPVL